MLQREVGPRTEQHTFLMAGGGGKVTARGGAVPGGCCSVPGGTMRGLIATKSGLQAEPPSAGPAARLYQGKALPCLRALTRSQHSGDNGKIHRRFLSNASLTLVI